MKNNRKKKKIVLSRKKAIILFGSVIGLTLVVWIGLMVMIFGGKEGGSKKPKETEASSDGVKIKHGYMKYSVNGDNRELIETAELDKNDNVTKQVLYYQNNPTETFEYSYDRSGRQTGGKYKSADAKGYFTAEYDNDGTLLMKEWDNYPVKGGILSKGTEWYEYDKAGNLCSYELKETDMILSSGATSDKHVRTENQYDGEGRMLLHKDVTFKDNGDEEEERREIRYEYYDNGNLKSVVDIKQSAASTVEGYRSETFYRENGEKEKMCEYLSGKLDCTTEYFGNVEMRYPVKDGYIFREDSKKTVKYDAEGRLIYCDTENENGGSIEENIYLEDGRLSKHSITDYYMESQDSGVVTTERTKVMTRACVAEYKYEGPDGRITEEREYEGFYGSDGSPSSIWKEKKVEYDYDERGNLIKKRTKDDTASFKVEVYEWAYDADDHMIRESRKRDKMKEEVYEWEYIK